MTDYRLDLEFENGERRVFDVKPYLDKGIFRELRDQSAFNSVRPLLGSVQWQGGQDFCPDMLYLDGQPVVMGADEQLPIAISRSNTER